MFFTTSCPFFRLGVLPDFNLTCRHRFFSNHIQGRQTLSSPIFKIRIKNPNRGGRNIRDRYLVLEKSLRGKEALIQSRNEQTFLGNASALSHEANPARKFRGFIIPIEPSIPESDECCMSGCAVCVYDLYEEALETYKESVKTLRSKLVAMNIPEDEWPKHIQIKSKSGLNTQAAKPASVVMSAFEEMERRLKEKHAAETQATSTNPSGS